MEKLITFLLTALLFPLSSYAFRLSPMVIEFAPQGGKATQVLTLENPGSEKIPIQIEAFTRGVDAKNEEVRNKTEDFNIYPEQIVLLPNEKRNVRITYAGGDVGAEEKSYRIVASQLPVEFKETNSAPRDGAGVSLNFLLQYVASAYVKPPGAKAKIVVDNVKKAEGKKVTLRFKNEGTAHKLIKPKTMKISSDGKVVAEVKDFKDFEAINLLPKTSQTVTLDLKSEIPSKNLKADFEYVETED